MQVAEDVEAGLLEVLLGGRLGRACPWSIVLPFCDKILVLLGELGVEDRLEVDRDDRLGAAGKILGVDRLADGGGQGSDQRRPAGRRGAQLRDPAWKGAFGLRVRDSGRYSR